MKRLTFLYIFSFLISYGYSQTNPTAISGLQLWLRADSNIVLNGSTVSSWNDCSGNGNNAIQNNVLYQPLLILNSLNNKLA